MVATLGRPSKVKCRKYDKAGLPVYKSSVMLASSHWLSSRLSSLAVMRRKESGRASALCSPLYFLVLSFCFSSNRISCIQNYYSNASPNGWSTHKRIVGGAKQQKGRGDSGGSEPQPKEMQEATNKDKINAADVEVGIFSSTKQLQPQVRLVVETDARWQHSTRDLTRRPVRDGNQSRDFPNEALNKSLRVVIYTPTNCKSVSASPVNLRVVQDTGGEGVSTPAGGSTAGTAAAAASFGS